MTLVCLHTIVGVVTSGLLGEHARAGHNGRAAKAHHRDRLAAEMVVASPQQDATPFGIGICSTGGNDVSKQG